MFHNLFSRLLTFVPVQFILPEKPQVLLVWLPL